MLLSDFIFIFSKKKLKNKNLFQKGFLCCVIEYDLIYKFLEGEVVKSLMMLTVLSVHYLGPESEYSNEDIQVLNFNEI